MMTPTNRCPRCAAELPAKAAYGLCPKCLLRAGLELPPDSPVWDDATLDSPAETEKLVAPSADRPAIKYFGDYELLKEIARGGMGVVYKARQTSLNRLVAVKMILAGQLAGPEDVERFRKEAQAAANLQHPHIVAIHEVGEHDGQHYFSMDYIDGPNLGELLQNQPLSARQAASYIKTLAETIAYAHEEGILHRDIKPSNVLVAAGAQLQITDFGLAKRIDDNSGMTATGQALGTPSYMAPEQASGKHDQIGPACDIYAIGAILYELLTARPPFRAETPLDTLMQVIENEPVPPRLLDPSVPKDLETICLKCLEKDPSRRYESSTALAADLNRFLNDEPILARPIGTIENLARRSRQHAPTIKTISLSVAAVVLLFGAMVIGRNVYRASRQGDLILHTEDNSLRAEFLEERSEQVVRSLSVPMEVPVSLSEGTYRVRLSAPGRMSNTSLVTIHRGVEQRFDVNLSERQIWAPIPLAPDEDFQLIDAGTHSDVIIREQRFGKANVRRIDGRTAQSIWQMRLDPDAPPDQLPTEQQDAWGNLVSDWSRGRQDDQPLLLNPAPDVNGDQHGDLVWLWPFRDDASLLAVSGTNGEVLWWKPQSSSTRISSLPVAWDVDRDGTKDVVALFYRLGGSTWIEAFRGTDGVSLWRRPLEHLEIPARQNAKVRTIAWRREIQLIDELRVLHAQGEDLLAVIVDKHLVCISPSDGALKPYSLAAATPLGPVQLVDVNGDGDDDVLAVQLEGQGAEVHLVAFSLDSSPAQGVSAGDNRFKNGRQLWEYDTKGPFAFDDMSREPSPTWPLIVDLDGNGGMEIVVPHNSNSSRRPLAVDLLDASTGASAWPQRCRLAMRGPASVKEFLLLPDVNSDAFRDIVVVSHGPLSTRTAQMAFFIDVLSGRDGQQLASMFKTSPHGTRHRFAGASWWEPESGSLPKLLLATSKSRFGRTAGIDVDVWSLASGKVVQSLADIARFQLGDFDGDGLSDICYRRQTPQGSNLFVLAGAPPQLWRRMGNVIPAADFNGDGYRDLIEATPTNAPFRGELAVFSGQVGSLLGRWPIRWPSGTNQDDTRFIPLAGPYADANRDGVSDIVAVTNISEEIIEQPSTQESATNLDLPMQLISGMTGNRIWHADAIAISDELRKAKMASATVSFIEPQLRKLKPSGPADLLTACRVHWRAGSGFVVQLVLAALEVHDGAVRWSTPLSEPMNLGNRYGSHDLPFHLADGNPDLNGDGVGDAAVAVAVRANGLQRHCQIVMVNGRDGTHLWRPHRLAMTPARDMVSHRLPMPVMGDVTRDGKPELLFVDQTATQDGHHQFELIALNGASGSSLGKWAWTASDSRIKQPTLWVVHTLTDDFVVLDVNEQDEPPSIVCLRFHTGEFKVVFRLPVAHYDRSVLVHDTDGDGNDEVIFFQEGTLRAVNQRGEEKWIGKLPKMWGGRFVGVYEGETAGAMSLLVQAQSHAPVFFGIDGTSGIPLWRGSAIAADRGVSLRARGIPGQFADVQVLHSTDQVRYPTILMQSRGRASAMIRCLPADTQARYEAPKSVPDVQFPPSIDPRRVLPLPWVPSVGGVYVQPDLELLKPFVASPLAGLAIYIFPGWLVIGALVERRWSLRRWLLLPVVVALALVAYQGFSSFDLVVEESRRLPVAGLAFSALGATFLIFPMEVAVLATKRRMRTISILLLVTILASTIWGAWWLSLAKRTMDPVQSFRWDGWYFILFCGAYAVGYVYLGMIILHWLVNNISRRWLRGSTRVVPN